MEIFLLLITSYITFSVGYYVLFSLAGLFYKSASDACKANTKNRFIIFIPAYREDNVIEGCIQSILKQNYDPNFYEIVLIADHFKKSTLKRLQRLPVRLLEVKFEKSTKMKALQYALREVPVPHDIAVILDADNVVPKTFLKQINKAFTEGKKVIQAHRTAKNIHTPFALLDGISEEINNHIFRKGHAVLGLSSALIGSGIAMEYSLYQKYINSIHAISGFDKELELRLLKDRQKIHYLDEVWVYDEKVPNAQVFQKQRTRWLAAQVNYAKSTFFPAFYSLLFQGNIDYFDKVIQFVLPPRILLLGFLGCTSVLMFLFSSFYTLVYASLLLVFIACLCISIPRFFYTRQLFHALLLIPQAFGRMLLALFQIRKARKKFLHTPHSS